MTDLRTERAALTAAVMGAMNDLDMYGPGAEVLVTDDPATVTVTKPGGATIDPMVIDENGNVWVKDKEATHALSALALAFGLITEPITAPELAPPTDRLTRPRPTSATTPARKA